MTPEPAEAITVRWDPARGPPRRVRFEPRSDGRWMRIESVWTGCKWRPTGREVVTDVGVEQAAGDVRLP